MDFKVSVDLAPFLLACLIPRVISGAVPAPKSYTCYQLNNQWKVWDDPTCSVDHVPCRVAPRLLFYSAPSSVRCSVSMVLHIQPSQRSAAATNKITIIYMLCTVGIKNNCTACLMYIHVNEQFYFHYRK